MMYCLELETGELVWKYQVASPETWDFRHFSDPNDPTAVSLIDPEIDAFSSIPRTTGVHPATGWPTKKQSTCITKRSKY
jgi:hypothetical protein